MSPPYRIRSRKHQAGLRFDVSDAAEILVIYQIPLSASILVAPSVTLAREINPLWMTELITHEVQVTSVDGRSRKQTDHLVQGNTSFHHSILVADLEVPVHVGINQAEDDGLVTHQCLVVAFAGQIQECRRIAERLLVHILYIAIPLVH